MCELESGKLEKPTLNELIVNCPVTGYSKEGVMLRSFEEASVSRIAKNISIGDKELKRSSRKPRILPISLREPCMDMTTQMHVDEIQQKKEAQYGRISVRGKYGFICGP
ncbi:hypothetical protein ACH5RR_023643 [Cinchona calisaya]|uniref:Uncharacterized protein n=1 Tax=Cinchona calisaya TaxID=153742 RepID=A0ABD2ZB93_9GENT